MKYVEVVQHAGIINFFVKDDVTMDVFRLLMSSLASALGSKVEWIPMPEAEVGRIQLKNGEVYAKLDFEYGLELSCKGLSAHEVTLVRTLLSAA